MSPTESHLAVDRLLDLAALVVAPLDDQAGEVDAAWPSGAATAPRALAAAALAKAVEGLPDDPAAAWQDDLALAVGALRLVAGGRQAEALALLTGLLDTPLRSSDLEARLEELGARLSGAQGGGRGDGQGAGQGDVDGVERSGERLALRFLERRAAYRLRYRPGHTVALVAGLAAHQAWLDDLAAMLGADPDDGAAELDAGAFGVTDAGGEPEPRRHAPSRLPPHPGGGFMPFAREPGAPGDEAPRPAGGASVGDVTGGAASGDAVTVGASRDGAMAYLVTLHHLEDARTADFSAHRIGWHELESGLDRVSDLVLSFERGSEPLLRQVDPEALSLRLFFGGGLGYDEFSTAAGSLFDVEVNPAELRIYVKLRRPAAWSATGLPSAELWRQLSSCVLITEPG